MKNQLTRFRWIVFVLLLITLIPLGASAQGSDPTDDDVNAIAKQLYCPVCENIPLDACGTAACEQWRGIIRDKLAEGWTEDQIKNYFVDQYGDRVLAEPPRRGFNWLVYIVPLVMFVVGGFMLYRGFKAWREADPGSSPKSVSRKKTKKDNLSEEDIQRIEEELKKRSGGL